MKVHGTIAACLHGKGLHSTLTPLTLNTPLVRTPFLQLGVQLGHCCNNESLAFVQNKMRTIDMVGFHE